MDAHAAWPPGVQQVGCAALCSLAENADSRARIMSSGGRQCVYAAMEAHPALVGVQRAACGALLTLATHVSKQQKARMAGDGRAVPLLRAAQAAHPSVAAIQDSCRDALTKLAR